VNMKPSRFKKIILTGLPTIVSKL